MEKKIKIVSRQIKEIAEEFVAAGPGRSLTEAEQNVIQNSLQNAKDKEAEFPKLLYNIVDAALYQSKHAGRNKVTVMSGFPLEAALRAEQTAAVPTT